MDDAIRKKFLTNTDETGRYMVTSLRTGKTYAIEPIGFPKERLKWGSIDPADPHGGLMHKKGDGKYRGSIDEEDSLITEENGFKNIRMLDPGTSPLAAIDFVDKQYPDAVKAHS